MPNNKAASTTSTNVPADLTPEPSPTPIPTYSTLSSPLNYALIALVFVVVPAALFVWLGGVRFLKRALGVQEKRGRSRSGSRSGESARGKYEVVRSEDVEK